MDARTTGTPRRWSNRSRCLAVAVSSVLSVAASLLCWRLVFAKEPPRPTSDYALSLVDGAGRPIAEPHGPLRLMLDPFTVYRTAPTQRNSSYSIDDHGFRGGMGDGQRPRVFLLGGSAAFGQDLPGDDDTITANLSSGVPNVEIVNAAVVGFLSGQELALMVHHLDRFHPAGYIVLDGWNELFDQYHFGGRPDGRLGFNNSFFDVENRLHAHHAALTAQTPNPRPNGMTLNREQVFDDVVDEYLANLDRMNDFALARGAHLLVALQPEIAQKRSLTPRERKALDAWNHAYRYVDLGFSATFERLIGRTADFCQSKGIPLVVIGRQAELAETNDELFLDPVHLSAAGSRVVAAILAREWDRLSRPKHKGPGVRDPAAAVSAVPLHQAD